MDYRLAMMCGTDLPVPECQLTVHQPKIKEIALLGEQAFFIGAQCLTLNKSMFVTEDKDVLTNVNDFQIFMMVMNEKKAMDKKTSTVQVLQLLLPTYKALFTPRSLVLNGDNHSITIDENNFEYKKMYISHLEVLCCGNQRITYYLYTIYLLRRRYWRSRCVLSDILQNIRTLFQELVIGQMKLTVIRQIKEHISWR